MCGHGRKAMGLGRAKEVWKGKAHVWAKAKKEVACQMAKSQGSLCLEAKKQVVSSLDRLQESRGLSSFIDMD